VTKPSGLSDKKALVLGCTDRQQEFHFRSFAADGQETMTSSAKIFALLLFKLSFFFNVFKL